MAREYPLRKLAEAVVEVLAPKAVVRVHYQPMVPLARRWKDAPPQVLLPRPESRAMPAPPLVA